MHMEVRRIGKLTLKFGDVVVLADETIVVDHVQFLACRKLFPTNHAREAFEVIDT